MGDEVSLIVVQSVVPIVLILGQVDLLSGPEGCFCLLVHLPDLNRERSVSSTLRVRRNLKRDTYLVIFDWEKNKTMRVLLQQWLIGFQLLDGRSYRWLHWPNGVDMRFLPPCIGNRQGLLDNVLLVQGLQQDGLDRNSVDYLETLEPSNNGL